MSPPSVPPTERPYEGCAHVFDVGEPTTSGGFWVECFECHTRYLVRAARGGSPAGEPDDLAERLGDKLCEEYDLRVSNSEAADIIAFVRAAASPTQEQHASGGSAGAATEAARAAWIQAAEEVEKGFWPLEAWDKSDPIPASVILECLKSLTGIFRERAALSEPRNVSEEGR